MKPCPTVQSLWSTQEESLRGQGAKQNQVTEMRKAYFVAFYDALMLLRNDLGNANLPEAEAVACLEDLVAECEAFLETTAQRCVMDEHCFSTSGFLYMLKGHTPVKAPDVLTWAKWFEDPAHVQLMKDRVGKQVISTVFLGVSVTDPPRLFETKIFGGSLDRQQWRYETWDEAVAGHAVAVERVKADLT